MPDPGQDGLPLVPEVADVGLAVPVEALALPRFERPWYAGVREARLLTATPWAMTGREAGFDPHPAISSATTAAPATARSSFFMRIRRIAGDRGGIDRVGLARDPIGPPGFAHHPG